MVRSCNAEEQAAPSPKKSESIFRRIYGEGAIVETATTRFLRGLKGEGSAALVVIDNRRAIIAWFALHSRSTHDILWPPDSSV